MVPFVSAGDLWRHCEAVGLSEVLQAIARYIEHDFARWDDFEKSARIAAHHPLGVVELMPIHDGEAFGFKYVNGHPANALGGRLTVAAFGLLADMRTGYPLVLADLTVPTALRTAVTSAIAAKHVAMHPPLTSMAVIGNGAQCEFQILAFHHLLGVSECRLFDLDPVATEKVQRNLAGVTGLSLVPCAYIQAAVSGADVVTTATAYKGQRTLVQPEWLKPGCHINAIGGDCPGKTEWPASVLQQSVLVVEYLPQTRVEGEIQQGGFADRAVHLHDLVCGRYAPPSAGTRFSFFDSVGFALEDFAVLRYLYDHVAHGVQRHLPLVPELDEPRNLFGKWKGLA